MNEAIAMLLNMLTDEGDGVLIQRPVYYPFTNTIEANKRRVVNNPLRYDNGRYEMDFADLEAKIAAPGTKGMILCSPYNPVGRVWTEQELRRVVEICKRHGKWVITDEIHCDIVREGVRHLPLLGLCPEDGERIIACTAPSKSFNLAGMQMSNIIIPSADYRRQWMHTTEERFAIGMASPLAITANIAAYNESEDWLGQVNRYIDENIAFARGYLAEHLPKAKMVDVQGTYLIWLDLRAYCADSKLLEEAMFQRGRVALDEGYIFGEEGAGFERINAACPRSVLRDCLVRMCKAVRALQK